MNNFESFSEDNIPRNAPKPLNVYQATAIPSVPEVSLILDKQCNNESAKKLSKENELISYRKWCTQNNNQLQQQFGKEYTPVGGNLQIKTTTSPSAITTKPKEQHYSNVPTTSSVLKLPNKSGDLNGFNNNNNKPNQTANKNVQFLLSNDNDEIHKQYRYLGADDSPLIHNNNNNNNNNKCAINCEYPNKTILRSSQHNFNTKHYDSNNFGPTTINYPTAIQMALQNNSQPQQSQNFKQSCNLHSINSTPSNGRSTDQDKCSCNLSNGYSNVRNTINDIQSTADNTNLCIPTGSTQPPTVSQLYDIIQQQQRQITNLQQNVEMILNICNNNNKNILNTNCDSNNNNNKNHHQNCIQLENNNKLNKIEEESTVTSATPPTSKNNHTDIDNDDGQLNHTQILQNIMKYMEMLAMNQQNNVQSRPPMTSNTIDGQQHQHQQQSVPHQFPNNHSKPECVHQIEKIITETSTEAATVTAAATTTTKTTQCNIYRHSLIINEDSNPQINNESKPEQYNQQYQSNPNQYPKNQPQENQQMYFNIQSQRNVYPLIRNNSDPCAVGSGGGGNIGDTVDKNTNFIPFNGLNTPQSSSSSLLASTKRVTFDETSTKIQSSPIVLGSETERSLAINALALEYLPKDMLNNIMNSNPMGYHFNNNNNNAMRMEQNGNGSNVKSDDLSMYQYLAKYGLIQKPQQQFQHFEFEQNQQRNQEEQQNQREQHQQQRIMKMFEESARQHVNAKRNQLEYDDNILDIHALKQQPKLL